MEFSKAGKSTGSAKSLVIAILPEFTASYSLFSGPVVVNFPPKKELFKIPSSSSSNSILS